MNLTKTSGRWDPERWPIYFLAVNVAILHFTGPRAADYLVAVNEILTEKDIAIVERTMDSGVNLFLDSGVFNLANSHAEKYDMRMDQALSLAPEDIDGFDKLFDRYVALASRWKDKVWGMVEIDQGGRENKIRTRARLEALGLNPMPVYHPFNDGWDYFDYLAERYDRICFGNVVQADINTRKRLVATAWERRRKYPKLWIHLLGLTPSSLTVGMPAPSCDSSTWLGPARWGKIYTWAATQRLWDAGGGFAYDRESDNMSETGNRKAWALAASDAHNMGRMMRVIREDQIRELGCDPTGHTMPTADARPGKVIP